jgi:3-methylcrotonyl-CoA carboxylase alpha subunit
VLDDRSWSLSVYAVGDQVGVFAQQGSAMARRIDTHAHAGDSAHEGGRLTAPMPGRVIAYLAQPGQAVRQGQPLAVMEAMKMEHTITSPRDGTVAEVLHALGSQVAEGEELLRLASS